MKFKFNINYLITAFFTLICITTPLTMFYSIFNIPLTIFLFIVWGIQFLIYSYTIHEIKLSMCKGTFLIFIYSLLQNIILFVFVKKEIDYMSLINFLFSLIICSGLVKKYFDIYIGYKIMKIMSVSASLFIIFQSLAYKIFGIIISGYIPFLQTVYSHYFGVIENNLTFRPASFFSEPAAYGIYVGLFLIIYLFQSKKNIFLIMLVVIGLLVSKSAFALGMLILVLIIACITYYKILFTRKYFLYTIIIFISVLVIMNLNVTNDIIMHVINFSDDYSAGNGLIGRIGNYSKVFELTLTTLFFGTGFQINNFGYLAGMGNLIINFGYMGSIFYLFVLSIFYKKCSVVGKVIIITMLYIAVFSNSIYGLQSIFYFPLIIFASKNLEIKKFRKE